MKPLHCLLASVLCLTAQSLRAWTPPEYTAFSTEDIADTSRRASAKASPSTPDGVWSFPDEDAEVAVLPLSDSRDDVYKIVLLFDEELTPPPGTVIGYLAPTASRDKWHAWLYTTARRELSRMTSPKEFAAQITFTPLGEDASMVLTSPGKGALRWHINPLSLIPVLRRLVSVRVKEGEGSLPYGLHRRDTAHRLRWF